MPSFDFVPDGFHVVPEDRSGYRPWKATCDDYPDLACFENTPEEAIEALQQWIAEEYSPDKG